MRFIFTLKHDTIENWEKVNPVLMEAEIVSVKEDGFYSLALGDGTNPFKKLPRIKLQEGLSLKLVRCGNGRIRIRAIEDTFREEEKILAKEEKTMSDNYAVINGKRIELTDEQVKALGIERKNPFDRVGGDDKHYYTIVGCDVLRRVDINDITDRGLYKAINYFNDKSFAEQVSLHQLLYRKLLKFAYDNECEDTSAWNGYNTHWTVRYDDVSHEIVPYDQTRYRIRDVYFSTRNDAVNAIEEVIKPFMKEHPEFVW